MTIRAPARPLSSPLNILDGTVIGRSVRRYRRQEFIHFLNALERGVASGKVIRDIVGNYAAHNSQLTFNFTRYPLPASMRSRASLHPTQSDVCICENLESWQHAVGAKTAPKDQN
jgi:hypothetical protein